MVLCIGIDLNGIHRSKLIHYQKIFKSKVEQEEDEGAAVYEFGFCGVIFNWDMQDKLIKSTSTKKSGYPDLIARIDIESCRKVKLYNSGNCCDGAHSQQWRYSFLVDFYTTDTGVPFEGCSRGILKKVIGRFEGMDLIPNVGIELEWFNYHQPSFKSLTEGMFGYSAIRPASAGNFFEGLLKEAEFCDIPIECYHTETGPGAYEAAIKYGYALNAADEGSRFKLLAKTTAIAHGIIASFMAKPQENLPGCGCHFHVSLIERGTVVNLFARSSANLKYFISGILLALPDIMPLLAPNINSYKRFSQLYWAPTTASWGFQHRLAAIRIIGLNSLKELEATKTINSSSSNTLQDLRAEIRVAGSDCNIHLATAVLLAAGLHGIEKQLPLNVPPFDDCNDEFKAAADIKQLPLTLSAAIAQMKRPHSMARVLLGDEFVDFYAETRQHEVREFESTVTEWERERYLELA